MPDKTISIRTVVEDAASRPLQSIGAAIESLGGAASRGFGAARRAGVDLIGALARIARTFTLVAAAAAAALGAAFILRVRRAAGEMSRVNREAAAIGVSAQTLQELAAAGELVGVAFSGTANALRTARENLDAFRRTGGGPAAEAFAELNVELRRADGSARPFDDVLEDISGRLAVIRDQQTRLRSFEQIFGTRDLRLLNLLGAGDIEQVRGQIRGIFGEIDDEAIARVDRMQRSFDLLRLTFRGLRQRDAAGVADVIADIVARIAAGVGALSDFTRRIVELVREALSPDGAIAQAARESLVRIFEALVELSVRSSAQLVELTVRGVLAAAREALPALGEELAALIVKGIVSGFEGAVGGVVNAIAASNATILRFVADKTGADFTALLARFERGRRAFIENLQFDAQAAREAVDELFIGRGFDRLDTRAILTQLGDQSRQAAQGIGEAFTDALGVLEEETGVLTSFQKRLDGVLATLDRFRAGVAAPGDGERSFGGLGGLFRGFSVGIDELAGRIRTATQLGVEMGRQVGQALTSGLGRAIGEVITGVRSIGDAFARAGARILGVIADLILQVTLLRIISAGLGLFGGFGGGGPTGEPFGAPGGLPGPPAGFAQGAVLLGGVAPASLPQAQSGLVVPATPGGMPFVAGEGGRPEGILPLARTPTGDLGVQAVGSGGSVNISVTVNVAGDVRDEDAARRNGAIAGREAAEQVLDAIARSTTLRRQFHAIPGRAS